MASDKPFLLLGNNWRLLAGVVCLLIAAPPLFELAALSSWRTILGWGVSLFVGLACTAFVATWLGLVDGWFGF